MNIRKFFGFEEKRDGLQYVSNFSDALSFSPFIHNCTAMNLSAVYRATELISDSIAVLPIKIQRMDEKNGKNEIENHPLKLIFSERNNSNLLSKFTMMKLLVQSVILRGNGFALIHRAEDGTVTELQFLEPNEVTINYNKIKNELYYTVPKLTKAKHIEPCNMIHLIKNSYDGINGLSVLSYANRALKTANATEESAKSFFDNGMNLSGVLTVQGQLQQKQKDEIRASWAQAYANGGQGLAVLQGNMSYQPIQINAKDAQMIESRLFNIQDIARFFGISPVLLGDLSHASYNTIEAVQQEFLVHTLQPYVTMIENEFNRKLLKPSERKLNIILETNEILRTDKAAQGNYYSTMLTNGIMNLNEIRKELGLNPIDGGDVNFIPYTDISQNTLGAKEDKEEKPTDNEKDI